LTATTRGTLAMANETDPRDFDPRTCKELGSLPGLRILADRAEQAQAAYMLADLRGDAPYYVSKLWQRYVAARTEYETARDS